MTIRIKYGVLILLAFTLQKEYCIISAMMDIFSRKIISFNISNNLRTEGSLDCLNKALKQVSNPKGIIHHSDHGVQYCSGRVLNALFSKGMQVSFTGPNHCYDNIN